MLRKLMRMEERIVLDGAATGEAQAEAAEPAPVAPEAPAEAAEPAGISSPDQDGPLPDGAADGDASPGEADPTEVVFVDPSVPDLEALLEQLDPSMDVHVLEDGSDGLEQLNDILNGRTDVQAVHLLSHGSAGRFSLGSEAIDLVTAAQSADAWATLGSALADDGDLLLYGCDIGQDGQLVDLLASLTGADVAASNDDTGAQSLGGDWDLEVHHGTIETDPLQAPDYDGLLGTPSVAGLDNSTYTEQAAAYVLDADVTFTGGTDYSGGYLEFAIGSADAGEFLTLSTDGSASTVDGTISIVGNTVYRGDGTGALVIGSVDATHNGQAGAALRINFSNEFQNGDFNTGAAGDTTIPGWTVVNQQIRLNGTDQIAGQNTPTDSTYPANNINDANGFNGGQPIYDDITYGSAPSRTGILSDYDNQGVGDLALRMNTGSVSINQGYGVMRGPYVYSNGTVALQQNDQVDFNWKSLSGGDAFDAFGYLVDVSSGDTITILDQTGTSDNQETAWASETITIGAGQEGNYRFVFVAGSYDLTGGRYVGGELMIDDVVVTQANPPAAVDDADVTAIARRVMYNNTSDDPADLRTLTVRALNAQVQGGNVGSATATISIGGSGGDVDDAPTVTATSDNGKYTIGGPGVSLFSNATVSAVEAAQNITSLVLTATNITDGADELLGFDGQSISLTDGNTGTTGGGFNYSVGVAGGTATVTVNQVTTAANYTTLVNGLTYRNNKAAPTGADRVFTITSLTDSGRDTAPHDNASTPNLATTLGINAAPTLDNATADQVATQGDAFSLVVPADAFSDTDGDTLSYSATLADGSPLPGWLTFNGATRTFSGTPGGGDVGTISVKLVASDGNGGTATDTFDLQATPPNAAPTVNQAVPDQQAFEDSGFSFTIPGGTFGDADGDTLSYTATLADGSPLPGWLGFNGTTGTFSGTPTQADVGGVSIRLTASDGKGGSITDTFDLTVIDVAEPDDGFLNIDQVGGESDAPTGDDPVLPGDGLPEIQPGELPGVFEPIESGADRTVGDGTQYTPQTGDTAPVSRFGLPGTLPGQRPGLLQFGVEDLAEDHPWLVGRDDPGSPMLEFSRPFDGDAPEIVGHLSPADAETVGAVSYQLLDDPSGLFAVTGNRVVVKDGMEVDAQREYRVTIRMQDNGGRFVDQVVVIRPRGN